MRLFEFRSFNEFIDDDDSDIVVRIYWKFSNHLELYCFSDQIRRRREKEKVRSRSSNVIPPFKLLLTILTMIWNLLGSPGCGVKKFFSFFFFSKVSQPTDRFSTWIIYDPCTFFFLLLFSFFFTNATTPTLWENTTHGDVLKQVFKTSFHFYRNMWIWKWSAMIIWTRKYRHLVIIKSFIFVMIIITSISVT